jgi:hypothetical protein
LISPEILAKILAKYGLNENIVKGIGGQYVDSNILVLAKIN